MRAAALLLLACACSGPGRHWEALGRPWRGTPAVTVVKGRVEVEAFAAQDEDEERTLGAGVHWGASERTEIFVDALPRRRVRVPSGEGLGDTRVGVLHRFFDETELVPAGAFQLVAKVPTGEEEEGLSTGELDVTASIVASQHLGRVLGAFLYELEMVGEPGGERFVHRAILDVGVSLTERSALIFELVASGDVERDEEDVDLLAGLEVAVTPRTILDAYVALPRADGGDDGPWLFGIGTTLRFGN